MSKNYDALNELLIKTQESRRMTILEPGKHDLLNEMVKKTEELHRMIFDTGYTQGQRDTLCEIRSEIEQEQVGYQPSTDYYKAIMKCLQIIDNYKIESEDK